MSKSKGTVIELRFSEEQVNKAVMSMYTDPNRLKATDPGTVEGNPVFEYHDAFNGDKAKVEDFKKRYKEGKVGDVEVKKDLANALNTFLNPIREKREYYENNPKMVEDALMSGTNNARKIASETMRMVRSAMKIDSYTSKW
jgi:tryptophanyl-tRNA synthetase